MQTRVSVNERKVGAVRKKSAPFYFLMCFSPLILKPHKLFALHIKVNFQQFCSYFFGFSIFFYFLFIFDWINGP